MNWPERILRAKKTGSFTQADRVASAENGTCASASFGVPTENGMPVDSVLQTLDGDFNAYVRMNQPDKVAETLAKIAKRAQSKTQKENT